MATTFARDALAQERAWLSDETGTTLPSVAILQSLVSDSDSALVTKALEDAGGLALIAAAFGESLDRDDDLSPALERALEANTGNTTQQQTFSPESLADYVPYILLAGALIRIHYSKKKGFELDIPNPAINGALKKIADHSQKTLARMSDRFVSRPEDGPGQ
jgi:hypothetical protein